MCPHFDTDGDSVCDLCYAEITYGQDECATCGSVLTNGKCAVCDNSGSQGGSQGGGTQGGGSQDSGSQGGSQVTNKCGTCGGTLTNGKCATCDKETTEPTEPTTKVNLDGKKVIFIGNSYTYYGQTVIDKSSIEQSARQNDQGYFYQMCKANGMEVEVTNWVFGGHNIRYIFSDSCSAGKDACSGKDHKSYLTDRYFDYVVLQPGVNDIFEDASSAEVDKVINFFKAANPNVKFVLSVPYHCYGVYGSEITTAAGFLDGLKTNAGQGMIVSDWGGLVMDILENQVPNATLQYTKNTFIVAKSAKDGYHPNLLTGYITALMTYSAMTGDKAQGQTYAYCNDSSLSSKFNFDKCYSAYYKDGATSNFREVFASQKDMLEIQKLIDSYLSDKAYMNYNYKCATCGGTLTNGKCATCDKETTEPTEPTTKVNLDGKKVLFTGNSLTYYGQTVLGSAGTDKLVTKKQNDKGFFSQLCKENGATVNVANWTFSGHVFSEVFGGECASCTSSQGKSINHLDYLDDRSYDYVVMQSGPTEGTNDTSFLSDVENIMNIFKAGNPNTKFVLLVPYTAYGVIGPGTPSVAKNTLNNLKTLANQGVTIVDWGGVVMDILNKKVTVPNSTITYEKNTFVVAQKASDGFHPNVLSGYITTLMTYCAITGEKAQGKAYSFCNDPALRATSETSVYYNFDNFITKYYTVGTTNFDQVFASQNDMLGIQGLIDNHLSAKAYMTYSY